MTTAKTVTCNQARILLWYYSRVGDYPAMRDNEGTWASDRDALLEEDLIAKSEAFVRVVSTAYRLADRGVVFVDAMLRTALPVQRWVMPE